MLIDPKNMCCNPGRGELAPMVELSKEWQLCSPMISDLGDLRLELKLMSIILYLYTCTHMKVPTTWCKGWAVGVFPQGVHDAA